MFGRKPAALRRKSCPICNSSHVRRSHRRGLERLLLPFISACRCNECGHRFYTTARSIKQSGSSPMALPA